MTTHIRVFHSEELLTHSDTLCSVYVDAFCAPPWNEDEGKATAFLGRLREDVKRPASPQPSPSQGRTSPASPPPGPP